MIKSNKENYTNNYVISLNEKAELWNYGIVYKLCMKWNYV